MVKKIGNKTEILKAFEDINSWKTIKQISKFIGLSYQPSYTYLKELENQELLRHKREGNSHFYSLNLKNKRVLKEISNFEFEKSQKFLRDCNKKINLVLNEFILQIEEIPVFLILLFGSIVRKDMTLKSDIDIFIVSNDNEDKIKRICNTLNMKYNVKLSSVVVSLEEFRKMLYERNEFAKNLIKERVILYGYENYLNELVRSMEKLKWV